MIESDLPLSRFVIDRAAARRHTADLAQLLTDPTTRIVTVTEDGVRVNGQGLDVTQGESALAAETELDWNGWAFLGVDDDGAWLARLTDHDPQAEAPQASASSLANPHTNPAQVGTSTRLLQDIGHTLSARDAGLATAAVALRAWHRSHTHCPRCGAPTIAIDGGWLRRCPVDGSDHYPRTDPAMIVAVFDDDDRLLLGRSSRWPARRFSLLAGFAEPGESLEATVRREVMEEVGITLSDVHYLASQPWPFPGSLMLACWARARTLSIAVDADEIVEAAWWTREDVRDAVAKADITLPMWASIARAVIEEWLAGALPGTPLARP